MDRAAAEGAPVMISAMFKGCDANCGAVVRIGEEFCDTCATIDLLYEAKRRGMEERNRRFGVGDQARQDVGVEERPDAYYDPVQLACWTTLRERLGVLAGLFAVSGILWAVGWMFAKGCEGIAQHFAK